MRLLTMYVRQRNNYLKFIEVLLYWEVKMKKITIIFIVVLVLLSFVKISSLAKPSETWNQLKVFDKRVLVFGVRQGAWMFMKQLADCRPTQFANSELEVKFLAFYKDAFNFTNLFLTGDAEKGIDLWNSLVEVIDDLYKDPANSYVPIANMCLIASRKLRGEPIESLLRELRKDALP